MSKQEITMYTLKKEVIKKLGNRQFTEKIINTVINHLINVFSGKKNFQTHKPNGKIQYCFSLDFKALTLAACHIHLNQDKSKYLLRCRSVTSIKPKSKSTEKAECKTQEHSVSYSDMECFFYALLEHQSSCKFSDDLTQRIENALKLVQTIKDSKNRNKYLPAYINDNTFKTNLFFYLLSATDFNLSDRKYTYEEILETIEKAPQEKQQI